jgi:hypothetical protein
MQMNICPATVHSLGMLCHFGKFGNWTEYVVTGLFRLAGWFVHLVGLIVVF